MDSRHRVLLVYPPGATARGMAEALAGEGVETETVQNVYRAVSAFTSRPFDLVVLGVAHLEDRDLEVIRVLRELAPDVYILLAFPTTHRDRAVKAVAFGADSYVLEPFYLGEFLDIVRRGLVRAARRPVPDVVATEGSEALERLAGAVAHAINNPLQILELLLSEGGTSMPDPEEFRQETRRIEVVVAELLAFARRDEIRREPVDLNAVLREALPESGGRKHGVRHELTPGLPEITGDPTRLAAAFAALGALSRARSQKGRLVVVTEMEDENDPMVTIRLTAPELLLSPEESRDLFRPFAGPLQGQVGLAAATARAVVGAHGGKIEVNSLEGEGTDISVRLPVPVPATESRA